MEYSNLLLYYFSGTGNARYCAQWIAEMGESQGISTSVISIERFSDIRVPALREGKTLTGFLYPTHGFNAAPLMLQFISRFPRKKNMEVFLLNTRAGMKLSRLYLPGLSGLALFLPALILLLKGYRVKAIKPVDLPSNWISLHPGLKPKVVHSLFIQWKKNVLDFSFKLLEGKYIMRGLYDVIQDALIAPVAIGYYLIGRFALAKTFIATDACNGCGLCEKECPTGSIKMINNLPYWKFSCENCMHCMNHCPKRAIQTTHSYTALIWYVSVAIAGAWLVNLAYFTVFPESLRTSWLYEIMDFVLVSATVIIFSYLAYRFLHFLMRYRLINRMIHYTSFTSYSFWRRYKAPKGY